jgi:SAM-dependent methyltransferase
MNQEIDLMRLYPKGKSRHGLRPSITEEDRAISRRFDFDYFDGDRRHGYGGFRYNPIFWAETVKLFRDHYGLAEDARILDVGCAKGFMLADFRKLMPRAFLRGIDVSSYAIENAEPYVRDCVQQASADAIPFPDQSFDLVISINTIHNLEHPRAVQALREVQRVSRKYAFVMVDGWHNDEEKRLMHEWVLTAKTMMYVDEWKQVFCEAGYLGDYWFWVVT